jgi:hypothetical protein
MNWTDPLIIVLGLLVLVVLVLVLLVALPQFPGLRGLLVGVGTNPQVVALFRALLAYALPGTVVAATAYINHWTDPRLLPLVPVLLAAMRAAEGRLDAWLKPQQNAVNPPPVAGGGTVDLIPQKEGTT